jgi:hypothetical protein
MNIQIKANPAISASQLAQEAKRRKALWFPPQKVVKPASAPIQPVSVAQAIPQPVTIIEEAQKLIMGDDWKPEPREHVNTFLHYLINNRVSPMMILDRMCAIYGWDKKAIQSDRRFRDLVWARKQIAWEIYSHCPDVSYPQIGKVLGGRDHTSALYFVQSYCKIMGIEYVGRCALPSISKFLPVQKRFRGKSKPKQPIQETANGP